MNSDRYFFSQGNAAFANGEYSKAISFYTSAIQLNPQDLNLYNCRCISYIKNNELENALRDADWMIQTNSQSELGYICYATALFAQKKLNEAEDMFSKVYELWPKNETAIKYLRKIQSYHQDIKSRDNHQIKRMIKEYQTNPGLLSNHAGKISTIDTFNNYLSTFDRPVTIRYNNIKQHQATESFEELLHKAQQKYEQRNYKDTIKICHDAINKCTNQISPSTIHSLFQLISLSYAETGDIKSALHYSSTFNIFADSKGIKITENDQKFCHYFQTASLHFTNRLKQQDAMNRYKSSRSNLPMPEFFLSQSAELAKNNLLAEQIQVLDEACALLPHDASILVARARARKGAGDVKGTVSDCRRALRLRPGLADALVLMARVYTEADRNGEARALVGRALAADRDNAEAVALLVELEGIERERREEAMRREEEQRRSGEDAGQSGTPEGTAQGQPQANPISAQQQAQQAQADFFLQQAPVMSQVQQPPLNFAALTHNEQQIYAQQVLAQQQQANLVVGAQQQPHSQPAQHQAQRSFAQPLSGPHQRLAGVQLRPGDNRAAAQDRKQGVAQPGPAVNPANPRGRAGAGGGPKQPTQRYKPGHK